MPPQLQFLGILQGSGATMLFPFFHKKLGCSLQFLLLVQSVARFYHLSLPSSIFWVRTLRADSRRCPCRSDSVSFSSFPHTIDREEPSSRSSPRPPTTNSLCRTENHPSIVLQEAPTSPSSTMFPNFPANSDSPAPSTVPDSESDDATLESRVKRVCEKKRVRKF